MTAHNSKGAKKTKIRTGTAQNFRLRAPASDLCAVVHCAMEARRTGRCADPTPRGRI